MEPEIFVDAGAWIAISDSGDQHHPAGVALLPELFKQYRLLVTTNLVVAEVYVLIRRRGGGSAALKFLQTVQQSNRILKICADAAQDAEAEKILRQYADRDFSLVDAVSFAVMRERRISTAFAFDRHFVTAGFALVP